MKKEFPYSIYNIQKDIYLDRNEISKAIMLREFNIKETPGENSFQDLTLIYSKLISQQPRRLLFSKSLTCPDEIKNGFELFKSKVLIGDTLNPHLSKRVLDPKFNDGMLIDFGVYHFHLGTGVSKDGLGNNFSQRSGPVLAAFVDDSNVYCLKISDHGDDLWLDEGLIEILHNEFPHTIAGSKIHRDIKVNDFIDINRKAARRAKFNTHITVSDGTTYLCTGGGATTAGNSLKSSMAMIRHNRQTRNVDIDLYKKLPYLDYVQLPDRYCGPLVLKMLNITGRDSYFYDRSLGNYYCCNREKNVITRYCVLTYNAQFIDVGNTKMNNVTWAILDYYRYDFDQTTRRITHQ